MKVSILKPSKAVFTIGLIFGCCTSVLADNQIIGAPAWATPARGSIESKHPTDASLSVSGSDVKYTQTQIDDKFSAPDWFPSQHIPMPTIVKSGKKPKVWACASCHLTSGTGHPESATLAGLSSQYIQSQMRAFANDSRLDYSGHMNRMAKALTTLEIIEISDWFASLPAQSNLTVIETSDVATTFVDNTRMRLLSTLVSVEPLNGRIIEVPKDLMQTHKRHPDSQFISYVPVGSLERGKHLVNTGGGKTIACLACHGSDLTGSTFAPNIVGNFGTYTVRQLHGFKGGTRKGAQSALMNNVVLKLNAQDIVDISAYLSSLSLK